ncbi:MAG: anthranilate phosphoribosyltransferase, partial [Calditrichia bacterium]
GGSVETNKEIFMNILQGQKGGPRDVVIFNAAAALKVSGLAGDLTGGIRQASRALDSGAALNKLKQVQEVSRNLM